MNHLPLQQCLIQTGKKVRDAILVSIQTKSEEELLKKRESYGDDEFTLDIEASDIIEAELGKFADKHGIAIELIGESWDNLIIGKGEKIWIVHCDPVDGTREISHKVGVSYFEAGILPWSDDPRLADTIAGIAVVIGHDPIDGRYWTYVSDPKGSYRIDDKGNKDLLKPTKIITFENCGFLNVQTSFQGTGALHILKDRMLETLYRSTENKYIFHREVLTSCGECLAVARGAVRATMDLRPAVTDIAKSLELPGYNAKKGLCMHPYDQSAAFPIIRDSPAEIRFFDESAGPINPKDIRIKEVTKDLGYICAGNLSLLNQLLDSLGENLNDTTSEA